MTRYLSTDTPVRINAGEGPFLTGAPNELYHHYYARLTAIATTRFRWLGFGPWVDPMRVEWLLVTRGLCAFTHVRNRAERNTELAGELIGPDPDDGVFDGTSWSRKRILSERFTVTQATVTGYLDDTYTPAGYATYAPNGAGGITFKTTDPLDKWDGVPIWGDANRSMYDALTIALFAKRLAQAALVVDTNLRQTMRGKVLAGVKQDKLQSTFITLDGVNRGIDLVTADKETVEAIQALDLGVHPDTVERSHIVAMRLWAEALEALGVESPAPEKAERMITDEVNGDHSQIAAIRRLTLAPRRRAAELINRRYFDGVPVIEVVDQW